MAEQKALTVLCISSYFKGERFIQQAKAEGCRVLLLTEEKLAHERWPRESIDEFMLMPDLSITQHVLNAVSYLYRSQWIDLIVPLDEYDVENVATLREHLRQPGMGQTATRFFRDKLAMRMRADEGGVLVPPFTSVFNYDRLRDYMSRIPAPYILKPRTQAGSMGIKKINHPDEIWPVLEKLGDEQSGFVLEQFIPGDVYHVDSIITDGKIVFASAQKYGAPPFSVYHGGGIFSSRTLPATDAETVALKKLNEEVISVLGMDHGVTHAEFIKAHADGRLYFLEVAARVGGANLSDMIEQATGVNLWAEWLRLEIAHVRGEPYQPPKAQNHYAGMLQCLSKQEHPDMSSYHDPEIVWKLDKKFHAGLIVKSERKERVEELLAAYTDRFATDFLTSAPPMDKPVH
jgi:glutathione synthase/RimK-type ligase-like ATP-grasp enzyme